MAASRAPTGVSPQVSNRRRIPAQRRRNLAGCRSRRSLRPISPSAGGSGSPLSASTAARRHVPASVQRRRQARISAHWALATLHPLPSGRSGEWLGGGEAFITARSLPFSPDRRRVGLARAHASQAGLPRDPRHPPRRPAQFPSNRTGRSREPPSCRNYFARILTAPDTK